MRQVFADSFYWIALTDPRDVWHGRALTISRSLAAVHIVTTEPILIELLNFFAEAGPHWRRAALGTADKIRQSSTVDVLPYTQYATLSAGMELYAARHDKGYSLTDCISMREMRDREIYEILTHDAHFAQEGFVLLLQ